MHAETLLYMLLQSPHTLPPPGFAQPSFSPSPRSVSAITSSSAPERIHISATSVVLGHHDLESEDLSSAPKGSWESSHEFGWDNEHSDGKAVEVGAFEIEWRGVTNAEYKEWLVSGGGGEGKKIPGSWIEQDGAWMVSLALPFPSFLGRLRRSMLTSRCLVLIGQDPLRPPLLQPSRLLAPHGFLR
jgi:hypothetical protein